MKNKDKSKEKEAEAGVEEGAQAEEEKVEEEEEKVEEPAAPEEPAAEEVVLVPVNQLPVGANFMYGGQIYRVVSSRVFIADIESGANGEISPMTRVQKC